MKPVLPFVHSLDADEEQAWIAAIEAACPQVVVRPLTALTDRERAAARVAIVANPDPAEIASLPGLVWIQSLWAGVERLAPHVPEHIAVVRMVDPQLAATMAESVLACTLYLHRDMPAYARQQRDGLWRQREVVRPQDRVVGVLGLGHMGATAARRLAANGFRTLGWSASPKEIADVETFCGDDGFGAVLERADIIVVLLPLTSSTRGLIGRSALARMKPGASLINFGRGAVLDDAALLERLDIGALDHAVLDVFAVEPLPSHARFWTHQRVTVLPHISAPTNVATASAIVAGNLELYFRERRIPETVDRRRGY